MSDDIEEEVSLPDTKYEMEYERTLKWLKELFNAYKHQRHSEVFKRCASLESDNLRLRKELQKMVKYSVELQDQLKRLRT